MQQLIASMATLDLNSGLRLQGLLIGGSNIQGSCPASEINYGASPEKAIKLRLRQTSILHFGLPGIPPRPFGRSTCGSGLAIKNKSASVGRQTKLAPLITAKKGGQSLDTVVRST